MGWKQTYPSQAYGAQERARSMHRFGMHAAGACARAWATAFASGGAACRGDEQAALPALSTPPCTLSLPQTVQMAGSPGPAHLCVLLGTDCVQQHDQAGGAGVTGAELGPAAAQLTQLLPGRGANAARGCRAEGAVQEGGGWEGRPPQTGLHERAVLCADRALGTVNKSVPWPPWRPLPVRCCLPAHL